MGNTIYAIPMRKIYDESQDAKTKAFVEDLHIDFTKKVSCRYPTIIDIRSSIESIGLKIEEEKYNNYQGIEGWCCRIIDTNNLKTLISVDKVRSQHELITDIISFPDSNSETSIRLLIKLEQRIGNILLYCDSGEMTIIKNGKTVEQIFKEFE